MPADIATLLAEAPWLARLARSLTGDAAEADDIVQETYAAALRSPPDDDRPVRPWLRRVAVNFARMRHRGRVRREANEQVELTEPVRTPDALLERAQLERRLAELVIALDEPYRATVLLRYREGLTAEQIAKQQGIPAGTVRSRLKTALDRLRRELDDGARPLRALLAPLLATPRRIVMAKAKAKLFVVLVLLLLLGAGALLWQRDARSPHIEPAKPAVVAHVATTIFTQPGVAAQRVRGRVTSDGAPYRGAKVQLVHAETEALLGEATSAADGTFDLGERGADVYVVTATAPDRAAMPVRVDLRAAAKPIEIELAGCSHLRGTVVDGSGAPIDHARIARDGAATPFAETDVNGHYDLCTHFGSATIRYSAAGYQSVVVYLDIFTDTARAIVLIPEATVEGTVVTDDGAPVPDAWVVIDPSNLGDTRNGRATAVSDHDGTFRITGVSPGRNLIQAFAPGMQSSHKQEIVAGPGQATTGIVVKLARIATITGVVVRGGTPVAGVGVGMRIGNRDTTGVLAVTQADGSFVIDRAPRGDVGLYVQNHTVVSPRSVHVEPATRVRIEVEAMGSVRGRVLRHGEPVPDAQVSCPMTKVFTDASGAYLCEGVEDGPQEMFADAANGDWGTGTATVTRGETAVLDIALTFSATICGRVVDEHGAPVAGIGVSVAEKTTGDYGLGTTAADGTYCAYKLTGGTYDVAVHAGPRVLEIPIAPVTLGPTESAKLDFAVTAPRLSITGTVSDPSGAPVVDAIVRIVAADRVGAANLDQRVPSAIALTDQGGRFVLAKIAAGDYMLVATARDGSEVITPSIAAGARDVVITLAAAGRIDGQLVGFASAPTITGLFMTRTNVLFDAEVDGARFRASGLSPGTYVLMAVTDAREADTQKVVVRAGETTRVTLTNRGTATITGVVRDFKTRAPTPGVRCSSAARQGNMIGAIYAGPDEGVAVDAHGAFRMASPAGEVSVICIGNNVSGLRLATVPRDRTTAIEVLSVTMTQQPGSIDAGFDFLGHQIRELVKGGAADRAGLLVGDEVIAVDGASVVDLGPREMQLLITQRPAGTAAQLTILRGTEQRAISVIVRAAN